MIHPINIPADLLSANARHPPLMRAPNKPKLSYTSDGLRLEDGIATAPREAGGLWNDFFLRSFAKRMAADDPEQCCLPPLVSAESPANALCGISSHTVIDVVDFEPDSPRSGVGARKPLTRQDSVFLNVESVISTLCPCCSDEADLPTELLRFNFGPSNCFSDTPHNANSNARKGSITLIPTSLGRRVRVNRKSLDEGTLECEEQDVDVRSFGESFVETCEGLSLTVSSVSIKQQSLVIRLRAWNHAEQPRFFHAFVHCHLFVNGANERRLSSFGQEFLIGGRQDEELSLETKMSDEMRSVLADSQKQFVITVLGKFAK